MLKIILKDNSPTFQQKSPCERPLKTKALDLYCGKTYIKCYNFFQQCEDYFAIVGATKLNCIFFAITFLKNQALFC